MKREELKNIIKNLEGQELTRENILKEVKKQEKYKNVKLKNIGIFSGVYNNKSKTGWNYIWICTPSNSIRVRYDKNDKIVL